MKIDKFLAHRIVSALYIPDGESWCISFPKGRTCYTWSYTSADEQYHIFAANKKDLEKAGGQYPVRRRDGYDLRLDFTSMQIAAFDCWKCIAHFSRDAVFTETSPVRHFKC